MTQHPRAHLVAVALGVVLGFVAARVVLVGSGATLVPWAVVGLALGGWQAGGRAAATVGAAYGFALSLAFMAFSYDGHAAFLAVAALDLGLACFGAACGAALATTGAVLRRRLRPR